MRLIGSQPKDLGRPALVVLLTRPPSASDWAQSSTVGDLYEPSSHGQIKGSNPVFRANDPRLSESTKAYLGRSERTTRKEKERLQGIG